MKLAWLILAVSIPATKTIHPCERQPPLGEPSSKAHRALGRGAMPQLALGVDWIRCEAVGEGEHILKTPALHGFKLHGC